MGPLGLRIILTCAAGCAPAPQHDVVIRHGTIDDGTVAAAKVEDLGIDGDRVGARGDLGEHTGAKPGRVVRGPEGKTKRWKSEV
jgi:hypothetical protein